MRGLVIWVPMLADDTQEAACLQAESWNEVRADQWWDARKLVSDVFRAMLGLELTAWDVYLLYRPGVRWDDGSPPSPTFWMHQIPGDAGTNRVPLLDAVRLSRELAALLPPPAPGAS
jgi:hypothetical protein